MVLFSLVLTATVFHSCGLGFAVQERLVDSFYLVACDARSEMSVTYRESENGFGTVIGETVFAVGANDSFIIAKQRPGRYARSGKFEDGFPGDSVRYYIIEFGWMYEERKQYVPKVKRSTRVKCDGFVEESVSFTKYQPKWVVHRCGSMEEFEKKRQEVGVFPALDFTLVFEDLAYPS